MTGTRAARRRVVALAGVVLTVFAGLIVHTALPDTPATDIAGDALYTAAIYGGIVVVAPRWSPGLVGAIAIGWCVAVELFQLTGLPVRWGEAWAPLMLVFGTVFDARDLLIYVLTGLVLLAVDLALARHRR